MDDTERRKAIELLKEMRSDKKPEDDKPASQESRLNWMYKGPSDLVDREEYLLGKTIDKTFEVLNSGGNSEVLGRTQEQSNVPKRLLEKTESTEQVDIAKKILEDPLYAIKQKELEARKKLLNNPVKLKQIKQMLLARSKTDGAHKKAKKKKNKKEKMENLDRLLLKMLKKFTEKEKRKALSLVKESDSDYSSSDSSSSDDDDKKRKKRTKNKKRKQSKSKRKRSSSTSDEELDSSSDSDSSSNESKTTHRSKKRKKGEKETKKSKHVKRKKESSSESSSSDSDKNKKSNSKKIANKKNSKKSSSSDSSDSSSSSSSSSSETEDSSDDEKNKTNKNLHHNRNSKSRHDQKVSNERGRSNRSDEKDNHGRKRTHRAHSSEDEKKSRKNYGLMMPDGSRPEKKGRTSPVQQYQKKVETKSKYVAPPKPKPLSEKEREEKLKEMMKDAKLRKEDREKGLASHRKKQIQEEESKTYDDDFMRRQMSHLTSQGTMADRIKSNINNIQRSKSSMDSNFMRK